MFVDTVKQAATGDLRAREDKAVHCIVIMALASQVAVQQSGPGTGRESHYDDGGPSAGSRWLMGELQGRLWGVEWTVNAWVGFGGGYESVACGVNWIG